jgi:hypothetical protein
VLFSVCDRGLIIHEVAEEVRISYSSSHVILTRDFGMSHLSAKFVLQLLTLEQKGNHLPMASDLPNCTEANENFLTGYKTWVYG